MSKYYTPDISEFHVGFEYYEIVGDQEPVKKIFDGGSTGWVEFHVEGLIEDWTYVKYLDREDIESLGFEYYEREYISDHGIGLKNNPWTTYIKGKNHAIFMDRGEITIVEADKERSCWYYEDESPNYSYFIKFRGMIKNKSELKKVLHMIGV